GPTEASGAARPMPSRSAVGTAHQLRGPARGFPTQQRATVVARLIHEDEGYLAIRGTGSPKSHVVSPASPGACATALQYLSQARHADEHSLQSRNMLRLGMIITLPPGITLDLDFIKGTPTAKG